VRALTALIAALLVGVVTAAPAPAKPRTRPAKHRTHHAKHLAPPAPATFADGDGLHIVSQTALDPRLRALTVSTAALPGPANVRILLPAGYAAHPHKRYPVLYLLHGTSGGAADWTTMGGAEQTTAGLPLIVVMPDIALHDNGGGWCTNSVNNGAFGPPEWETFHIDQLIPWIDHNLRTIASRSGRAIAGLSQGGFCSMSYAARHPDLFETALSFSGAPDIAADGEAEALARPIILATEVGLDGVAPNSFFGDPSTDEINWAAHDPATLAGNLRGMNLSLYTGNGKAGPFDAHTNAGAQVIEGGVHTLTQLFHARLQGLGIPSLYDDYGPGTHSWPYWARDLRWSIGQVMSDFAHPSLAPNPVTYTTDAATYSVFGWQVALQRTATEFSTLADASAAGFTLNGSGSATVQTPAQYARGGRYSVTVAAASGTTTTLERVGASRRLQVNVPLGPANKDQEYTLAASLSGGTKVYSTDVTIEPASP
jgi:S-formylglutathione hydrolase FrmB